MFLFYPRLFFLSICFHLLELSQTLSRGWGKHHSRHCFYNKLLTLPRGFPENVSSMFMDDGGIRPILCLLAILPERSSTLAEIFIDQCGFFPIRRRAPRKTPGIFPEQIHFHPRNFENDSWETCFRFIPGHGETVLGKVGKTEGNLESDRVEISPHGRSKDKYL